MRIFEVTKDRNTPDTYRVECIDTKDGEVLVVLFSGVHDAEAYATEYAEWKRLQAQAASA